MGSIGSGCIGCKKKSLKTEDGIPRKLLIRKDNTPLYESEQMIYSPKSARQWQIYYIFKELIAGYIVSPHMKISRKSTTYFVKKSDVFEWNSYFCLAFKNSPHNTNRKRIKFYKTYFESLNDNGNIVIIEKPKHRTNFLHRDAIPILQEYDNSIYYIASLYDDIDENGNYVFLGNYNFAYVKYLQNAFVFRRYVNRHQFSDHILHVLRSQVYAKPNMDPTELDLIYGPLSNLLADFGTDIQEGVETIFSLFQTTDIPSKTKRGIFNDKYLIGEDLEELDPHLIRIYRKMVSYYENNSFWNNSGYAYIPAEWMDY